jgi:hypothetical protein
LGSATFVLGSANQGQAWVACYFDFRANRGAELNETGQPLMKPSPDYGWHSIGVGGNNCDELTQSTMSQSGFAKSAITWMCSKHLGDRKLALVLRVRIMLEIVGRKSAAPAMQILD